MKFLRRLRLYLIGVGLGCILVVFFFRERLSVLTSWLPNERVLLRLEMTHDSTAPGAQCFIECLELDSLAFAELFVEGDVRFDLSEAQVEPKKYVVDSRYKDRLLRYTFLASDSSAILSKIEAPFIKVNCPCDY